MKYDIKFFSFSLLAQVWVPLQGLEVHQHCPASIGYISHMRSTTSQSLHMSMVITCSLSGIFQGLYPYQPSVHSTKETFVFTDGFSNFRDILYQPLDLEGTEVSVDGKTTQVLRRAKTVT